METNAQALAVGVAHHQAGRLAEAEAVYRRILDAEPNNVDTLHLLGLIVRQSGRLPDGLALIHRALQLQPTFIDARVNLTNILRQAGRSAEAVREGRRVVALEPARAETWHDLGADRCARSSADHASTIAMLHRAVRLDPSVAEAHHDFALALGYAGRLDDAIDGHRRAVALKADLLPAHMNLGNALLNRGDCEEARRSLQRALTLDPGSAVCWYNIGNPHHTAGDLMAALRAAVRSARLGLGIARMRVAAVLTDLGRIEEAQAVLLDSLPRAGTDVPAAIEMLTGLLARAGRSAEARTLFARLAETPLAGVRYPGECLTALAALDLRDGKPKDAAERLAPVRGDQGWYFTVNSLAVLRTSLEIRGLRLERPPVRADGPRITSSSLASCGRFAHNVMEYILLRLYAEKAGCRLETPDWVGGTFFDLDDPPPGGPLPPLLFPRRFLNDVVTGRASREPITGRDILSPLFLFEHKEEHRERVQSWLRPRPVWAPWLEPAVERLRAAGSTLVAIHIRRGDFVAANYPITDVSWYVAWLQALWPLLDRPVLYLASDDLEAVRHAFADFHPLVRADVAPDWPGLEYLQDFHVMTQADVLGTSAASGFSELAARLNRRARLFVQPDMAARLIRPFQPWTA